MKTLRLMAIGLVVLALAAGCGDDDADVASGDDTSTDPPAGEPQYHGMVTDLRPFTPVTEDCVDGSDLDPDSAVSSDDPPICTDPANTTVGTVLVEEQPGVQEGAKISLTVDADTVVQRRTGDTVETIDFVDLSMGDVVDAWVLGPVAESYPEQARADAIVVVASA